MKTKIFSDWADLEVEANGYCLRISGRYKRATKFTEHEFYVEKIVMDHEDWDGVVPAEVKYSDVEEAILKKYF